MANWFVRPNISHNSTRDGKSYDTAWGGWSEILWGPSGGTPGVTSITAGDTLYVCDSHTYAQILTINPHSATAVSRVTIRGDYSGHPGVITFSSGNYYVDANQNYTTLTKLTFNAGNNACISPGGAPLKGLEITNNSFACGAEAAIKFRPFNTWEFQDCVIDGNTFTGGSGSPGGGCIQWYVTSAVTSKLIRLTIRNNTFTGNSATRATICLITKFGTALDTCTIEDLKAYNNTFNDCYGVAIEVNCRKAVSSVVYGANKGIKLYGNTVKNQGQVGILGGGFSITGFELSSTEDFGNNDIYDNWCSGLHGLTGFCNPMYGTYRVFNNYAENITTTDIDGCGVLFDHSCHDTVAYGNEFVNVFGKDTADAQDTGFGFLVLDATNILCYGNKFVNCLYGLAFGNKQFTDPIYGAQPVGQSSNIFNNTFLNCRKGGVYLVGGASNTTNTVRNNVFTIAAGYSAPAARVNSATWSGESYNCFHGFTASVGHTLHATTLTSDPLLSADGRPKDTSPLISAGVYIQPSAGVDRKTFWNPPVIGAYEYIRSRSART